MCVGFVSWPLCLVKRPRRHRIVSFPSRCYKGTSARQLGHRLSAVASALRVLRVNEYR